MRVLERVRDDHHFRKAIKLTLVRQALLTPGFERDVHPLEETLTRLCHIHPVRIKLLLLIPTADADLQTALAENVQRRQILGQAQRMVPGHDRTGHSDFDPGGLRRNRRQQAVRRANNAMLTEGMLRDPHGVKAQRLGELGTLENIVIHLGIRACNRQWVALLPIPILFMQQRPLAHKKTAKFHVPSLCGVHAVVSYGASVQGGLAFASQGLEAHTRAGILVCGV